jgi:TctA family transporter
MKTPSTRWPATPTSATGQRREPLLFTAMDLSHVVPGPRLAAENGRILIGLLAGLPLSLGLWLLLLMLVLS